MLLQGDCRRLLPFCLMVLIVLLPLALSINRNSGDERVSSANRRSFRKRHHHAYVSPRLHKKRLASGRTAYKDDAFGKYLYEYLNMRYLLELRKARDEDQSSLFLQEFAMPSFHHKREAHSSRRREVEITR